MRTHINTNIRQNIIHKLRNWPISQIFYLHTRQPLMVRTYIEITGYH